MFGDGTQATPRVVLDLQITRAERELPSHRDLKAWLIIPLVVGSDLTPSIKTALTGIKTALTAVLGATPLLTKLSAMGAPWIDFLKKHAFKLFRDDLGTAD